MIDFISLKIFRLVQQAKFARKQLFT